MTLQRGAAVPVLAWILLTTCALTASAQQGKVIELDEQDRKILALLGDGVVGKALPAAPIVDIDEWTSFGDGEWHYRITSGNKRGNTEIDKYSNQGRVKGGDKWTRHVGTEFEEDYILTAEGSYVRPAETDLSHGYVAYFDPPVTVHAKLEPGESLDAKCKLKAAKADAPDQIKYTGDMEQTLTYLGRHEVTVPAGTFEAILLRQEVKIHVGPAQVSDASYAFFAKGVGRVAVVEALKVAAIMVFHMDDKTARVLVRHP